jgi:hypothetical protein
MRFVLATATLLSAFRNFCEHGYFALNAKISHGESGGREVSVADRLLISFHLAIGVLRCSSPLLAATRLACLGSFPRRDC